MGSLIAVDMHKVLCLGGIGGICVYVLHRDMFILYVICLCILMIDVLVRNIKRRRRKYPGFNPMPTIIEEVLIESDITHTN